jgi:PAS domain S-box-containing protein
MIKMIMERCMPIKPFIRVLMLILCLASTVQPPIRAYGAEPVKIGVLAFRPKLQTLAQWQPLAAALKQAIPERDFVVEAFTLPELDLAVASRHLDFVLTNSGHYVLLQRRSGLSSPLATVAINENGLAATVFGGVIFSRAGQTKINTLSDIKGKTVATVNTKSLGGYQMQAYELSHAQIRMPQDVKLIITDMPHDKVVEAVLSGRADVGFVRSGVLEGMEHEGKLDIRQLKIINYQNSPGFPQQLSTRLYPEWPFAALPHIDENLARHVAAALFVLEDNTIATRAMNIHGFVVPADYSPVEDLLRELRLPPFNVAPHFTLQDVWMSYHWQILGALLAIGVILSLGVSLLLTNRKLAVKQFLLLQQQQKLQESEKNFRTVVDYTYGWELWEYPDGSCRYCSPASERVTGYPPEAFMADSGLLAQLILPEDLPKWKAHHLFVHGNTGKPGTVTEKANELDFRILCPDGKVRWIGHLCYHIYDTEGNDLGHRISNRDITERKLLEAEVAKGRTLESLGILISGIAHDFNNLFQGLLGNIQLAKLNTERSNMVFPFLEQAEQVSRVAIKLIKQLIALSQGGNSLPTTIQPASHIMEEATTTLAGSSLVAEFDLAETLWPITVEPASFRNVIKQMVLNAMEAMPPDSGGKLKIIALNESFLENRGQQPTLVPGNYVKISIQDQGSGIKSEHLPRIFDPYFSTKERGSQKGMGLGLALCDAIIRKHGGTITVESKPDKGTTFHIYLPAAVDINP